MDLGDYIQNLENQVHSRLKYTHLTLRFVLDPKSVIKQQLTYSKDHLKEGDENVINYSDLEIISNNILLAESYPIFGLFTKKLTPIETLALKKELSELKLKVFKNAESE